MYNYVVNFYLTATILYNILFLEYFGKISNVQNIMHQIQ